MEYLAEFLAYKLYLLVTILGYAQLGKPSRSFEANSCLHG